MSWPIQTTDVTAYMGVTPAGDPDVVNLERVTDAVVVWVERMLELPADPDPGPDVELGACMLAARWYARRSSSQGIASFGDFGPAYVARHDPDIASLLGLNKPAAG